VERAGGVAVGELKASEEVDDGLGRGVDTEGGRVTEHLSDPRKEKEEEGWEEEEEEGWEGSIFIRERVPDAEPDIHQRHNLIDDRVVTRVVVDLKRRI